MENLTPSETETLKMFDEYFVWNEKLRCLYVPSWGDAADAEDVKDFLLTQLRLARAETVKAFGGCTSCYGKGYNTVKIGEHSCIDFGDEVTYSKDRFPYVPCKHCNRGEQLQKLIEVSRADGRGNVSALRQWLNERTETRLITNEDINTFLDL